MLGPGGRLLFTDPVIITGIIDSNELAIRTSIGYFLFVPLGENERLLAAAGLDVLAVEDGTSDLALVARRRCDARSERALALRRIEGNETFEGRQLFFDMVATLARERRLGHFAYLAERPVWQPSHGCCSRHTVVGSPACALRLRRLQVNCGWRLPLRLTAARSRSLVAPTCANHCHFARGRHQEEKLSPDEPFFLHLGRLSSTSGSPGF